MERFDDIKFVKELLLMSKKEDVDEFSSVGLSYGLLHHYVEDKLIPLIRKLRVTIAIVELTTCGLISDLITSLGGSSDYFIMGIIPYHNSTKIKFGIPEWMLNHRGPGTVSEETAYSLAKQIKIHSNAEIGVAETGLISSNKLGGRKTKKEAGTIYLSIVSDFSTLTQKLAIQNNLSRNLMRQEIAFRILVTLQNFLNSMKK